MLEDIGMSLQTILPHADAIPFTVPASRWNDEEAAGKSPVELLLYRSNLLGSDLTVTNFGGGNTSAKLVEADPLTGEKVEVLWVKGSGGDIGSMTLDGFATLYQDKLLSLGRHYRGPNDDDRMVGYLPHCTFNLNSRAPSIDTPLHSLLPFAHVDHVHPQFDHRAGGLFRGRGRHKGNLGRADRLVAVEAARLHARRAAA